ncbi:GtrA family protein [Mesorhizobium retamae]|uniref:GtrA family protein n=1 Tax=Mesorhizobium retamae TaxID=2912854 RepID=A0ABS9QG49_9HYPH|nr:GtrA family protein [Mesorhizobium sp. IRAMC:0171]MCG7506403.1 GtrA family protein [Mesorhizobium sp. IRAMC:0171]
MKRLLRFGLVGGVGFLADAAILQSLLATTLLDPISARLVSIGLALFVTWLLNRYLTFAPSSRGAVVEGARYGGVGIASSALNYAVYAALILAVPSMVPLAALAIASVVAMGFSFLGYSRLVFDR